jgi:transcriptional regulator with XRE-family HTH domain
MVIPDVFRKMERVPREEHGMNQPDLGLKINELRQAKGLTQEQLAEKCEVSPRTIQRIESGEVDPRAYTLQCLSEALDFDFLKDQTTNENLWLALLHLSSVIPLLVFPLLLWSWKKETSLKIDRQGRQVLNFQVTMLLMLFLGGFLLMFAPAVLIFLGDQVDLGMSFGLLELLLICAPMPMILIGLFCTYQGVVNAMRALSERPVRYALSIPFVK